MTNRQKHQNNNDMTIKDKLGKVLKEITGANLTGANLRGADLRGADLRDVALPIAYCKWAVSYRIDGTIQVGCKSKHYKEWSKWLDSSEELETPRDSPEFKYIEASIRASIAWCEVVC